MGAGFSTCLAAGLKAPSLEFLERVDLSDNRLGPGDVEPLLAGLSGKAVRHLDLSKNKIGQEGAERIAEFARLPARGGEKTSTHANLLEALLAGGCDLGEPGALLVLSALSAAGAESSLTSLDFSENGLRRTAAPAIVAFLAKLPKLGDVSLAWNELTGEGAVPIFEYLKSPERNTALKKMNLEWNGIEGGELELSGSRVAAAIGEAVESSACTLEVLKLDHNKFSEEEVGALQSAAEKGGGRVRIDLALSRGEETEAMLEKRSKTVMKVEVLESDGKVRKSGQIVPAGEGNDPALEEGRKEVKSLKEMSREEIRKHIAMRVEQFKRKEEEEEDGG